MKVVYPFSETWQDYPDTTSNAVLVYMIGCDHNCPGCQNKDMQDPEYAIGIKSYDRAWALTQDIIIMGIRLRTNKVVIEGGDPLYADNIDMTRELLAIAPHVNLDYCIYTGYDIDFVRDHDMVGAQFYKCGIYNSQAKRQSGKNDFRLILSSPNQNFYDKNYDQISEDGILWF